MRVRTDKLPKFKAESDTKHKVYGVACTPVIQLKRLVLMFVLLLSGCWGCLFCGNNVAVIKGLCAIFLPLSNC